MSTFSFSFLLFLFLYATCFVASSDPESVSKAGGHLAGADKMGQTEGEEDLISVNDDVEIVESVKGWSSEEGEETNDKASDAINEPKKNRGRSAQKTAGMVHTLRSCFNENALRRTGKRKVLPTFTYMTGNPLVELATVIDHVDINNLNVLASCIRFYLPENVEDRQFDGEVINFVHLHKPIFFPKSLIYSPTLPSNSFPALC